MKLIFLPASRLLFGFRTALLHTTGGNYKQKMIEIDSIQVLTAGGRSEQAIDAKGHGLFTDHFLAALSGDADINSNGFTTETEMAHIGTNIGESAGQTIFQAHLHLIPRRVGDTPHPRGGVRGVIPDKMPY